MFHLRTLANIIKHRVRVRFEFQAKLLTRSRLVQSLVVCSTLLHTMCCQHRWIGAAGAKVMAKATMEAGAKTVGVKEKAGVKVMAKTLGLT